MASPSPSGSDPEIINHSTADITTSNTATPSRPPPLTRASTSAFDKCWICLSTRDEDPPSPPNPPTEWRSPCSCSLQAHESCLLDWIADQEAPRSRGGGRSGPSPDKILCPQCRSEIKVQRSIGPLVQLCQRIDKTYSRFVLPGLAFSLTGTILSGCYMHGRWAVNMVFGARAATEIYQEALVAGAGHMTAYCLIPINLIFARTRYSDYVLPSGTLFLLGTQLNSDYGFDWTVWPPDPATAFALLPAIRQSYNWLYETAFGELNRKWIKEVQPRREEGYEDQEGNIANIMNEHEAEMAEAAGDDGGVVLELELNLGAVENDDEALVEAINAAQQEAGEEANAQAGEGNNGGGRVHQLLGDNELMDDTSSIGQLVIGSLVMPAVAGAAGNLLQLVLPSSWTSAATSRYARPSFLSNKWARSLVGGLAFVAVKDILVLYCRWRLAEGHKKRKVMDYDKKKKEYVAVR